MLFFSYNVGSAVVMLFSALLFTLVTVLMGLVLIRVSPTCAHTHTWKMHEHPETHTQTRKNTPRRFDNYHCRQGKIINFHDCMTGWFVCSASIRFMGCTVAEGVALSVHRKSGPLDSGRVPLWERPASMLSMKLAQAYPNTPLCQATQTMAPGK